MSRFALNLVLTLLFVCLTPHSETTLFVVQSVLLVLICIRNDVHSSSYLNQTFKDTFVVAGASTPGFTELHSYAAWWHWMQTDFLDKMYWETWYNGQHTDFNNVSCTAG